jgi:uncharacterized phage-associated protein
MRICGIVGRKLSIEEINFDNLPSEPLDSPPYEKNGSSFEEKAVEAWKYGPVIPSIYEAYKKYGSRSIRQEKDLDISNIEGNSYLTKFLDHMFEKYSKFTGSELIALTHKEGTPWKQVYKPNIPHIEIERERIQSYYEDLLNCG